MHTKQIKNMRLPVIFLLLASSLSAMADGYDLNKPFGFCTVSSRTDASSTYAVTGGGIYDYSQYEAFNGAKIILKSNGQDMKGTIQNAIKQNDVVILDGADGEFIVSENIGFERGNKTILGINNARICTQWYLTDEDKTLLDNATDDRYTPVVTGVKNMSTSDKGGTLNGQTIKEQAEYITRKTLYTKYGNENYRKAGIFSLNKENVIIRNITFIGPGAVDVGGNDLVSASGAKHCWIDHCVFQDGMDGNFDITNESDFNTVSWCIFRYTDRSYVHQNTNLVGSSDSSTGDAGKLNTTYAFNWWAPGCNQRMPMARFGKIHMLNNYYSCGSASLCMNPRKSSEFLIEGNYFASNVKNCYRANDNPVAVTWADDNVIANTSVTKPTSFGTTVTVPYTYTVAPANAVPDAVQNDAGATLPWGDGGGEETGTKGSIYWAMSNNTNAVVSDAVAADFESTTVTNGGNLVLRTNGTYNNIRFSFYQAQSIQTEAADDNVVNFSLTTKSGYKFKASSVELYACKVATNNGTIDVAWKDAGGTTSLWQAVSPNRNNAEKGYFSYYTKDISALSTATEGTCSLIINIYNVGAMSESQLQKKDLGLAQILIKGTVTDKTTGISTPVTISTSQDVTYYNIKGQRVAHPTKGLYIVRSAGDTKGKKVFIK